MTRAPGRGRQAGLTLIEVLIAVTLLSVLSVGILMALRVATDALQKGNRNRATLAVARKLVAYLLAVDRREKPFRSAKESVAACPEKESRLAHHIRDKSRSGQALSRAP